MPATCLVFEFKERCKKDLLLTHSGKFHRKTGRHFYELIWSYGKFVFNDKYEVMYAGLIVQSVSKRLGVFELSGKKNRDYQGKLMRFDLIIIYTIHKILVFIKNHLNYLKDNIFECFFKEYNMLLIFFFFKYFFSKYVIMEI